MTHEAQTEPGPGVSVQSRISDSREINPVPRDRPMTGNDAEANAMSHLVERLRGNRHIVAASAVYVAERLTAAAIGFLVFTILARFYAPSEFGLWSYTIAIIQFASPFLAAGSEPIVVRELVRHADRRSEVLGSAAVVIASTTILATAIPLLYLYIAQGGEEQISKIAILASCAAVPNFMLVLEHYFRAETRPVPIVTARFAATVIGAAAKIALAFNGYSIVAISAVLPIEAAVQVLCLIVAATRGGRGGLRWSITQAMIRTLAYACLPAMISGLVVTIFFRVNYLLVQGLAGFKEVGYYALAFSLLQLTVTVPSLALTGIYPKLVAISHEGRARFAYAVRWLFFWGSLFGYMGMVVVVIGAHVFVPILFGSSYKPAATVASFMFLALIVITSGAVRAAVINIKLNTVYHLWSAAFGLVILVPVSYLLIPTYGAAGAAVGIVIGSAASAVVTTWLIPGLRPYAVDQIAGLFLLTPIRRTISGEGFVE